MAFNVVNTEKTKEKKCFVLKTAKYLEERI